MLASRPDTYAAFMLDHAAGNHPAALQLAGDLHALLSIEGARAAAVWSIIGGALLETATASPPVREPPRWRKVPLTGRGAAAELLELEGSGALAWRRGLSGIPYAPTDVPGGRFMRLDPGQRVPAHSHSSIEATVVLRGELTDEFGSYRRGDLMIGEPGTRHRPGVTSDETCVCYVAEHPRHFWRMH